MPRAATCSDPGHWERPLRGARQEWWRRQWQCQAPARQPEGRGEAAEPRHARMSGTGSPTLEKNGTIGHAGTGKAVGRLPDSISVRGVSYTVR